VVKLRQKMLARCKQEWRKGLTPAGACTDAHAPVILCAGIIVLDEVFRVERFPEPDTKAAAQSYFVVNGGCAAIDHEIAGGARRSARRPGRRRCQR
jgi:hypothetical protein